MKKRVLVISDLHCGHRCGLTPPAWQTKPAKGSTTKRNKWSALQVSLWRAFVGMLDRLGPFNACLYLGDGIDGSGKRSGGSELITTDPEEQADMAVACIDTVRLHAKRGFKIVGVYGTPYHTGDVMDHENIIASRAGFEKIGAHEWVDINGCVFDIKHKIGSSSVPHGRGTALAREQLWNQLWNDAEELQPKADVLCRGHVHYHAYIGGPGWVAMTVPALQGMGTKFGALQCSGLVHWGVTVFDVDDKGAFDWHCETVTVKEQKAEAVKI